MPHPKLLLKMWAQAELELNPSPAAAQFKSGWNKHKASFQQN
jgi:hypothetical protein